MFRNLLVIVAMALLSVGCAGDGSSFLGGFGALDRCDYGPECIQAVQKAEAVENASPELKARLLKIRINALMKFPPADSGFMNAIGLKPEMGYLGVEPLLERLSSDGDGAVFAAEARRILDFMKDPRCDHFMELEAVQKGAGLFAESAAIARLSVLIQVLSSVTAENSALVAGAVRQVVGCSMSPRADGAAVLVAAKSMLVENLAGCPTGGSGDAVLRALCEQGRTMMTEMSIPLPMVETRSGELAGALLPTGRAIGISFNPPWMISLSAGRLMVIDQPVVGPDAMEVPPPQTQTLLDLREPHRQEDIKTALHQALKTRAVWTRPGDERSKYIFVVVDRTTTFADLAEVMGGFMAETEAVPLVAVLPSGASLALWQPLNFFLTSRPLYSTDGKISAWTTSGSDGRPARNPLIELTPFGIRSGSRSVEFVRDRQAGSTGLPDLREVNRLAAAIVDEGNVGAGLLKISQAVTFDLLIAVIESLGYRMPESAFVSSGAYLSSQEMRRRLGEYDRLVGWIVLDRNW